MEMKRENSSNEARIMENQARNTRNSTNERFNVSAVMGQISPIRTNNDASVNSTTGGFNFRKLKPHDESSTSIADLKTIGA